MIPEKFWAAIKSWLNSGKKNGQIRLYVKDGAVISVDFVESMR